jgi:branched-chain amino acid transport system substrate-binding protein
MDQDGRKKITRRAFMKKVGKGAAALSVASAMPSIAKPAKAAKRDYILIGRPNPATGPLAGFGEASPWADEQAIEAINKKGGIYIKEYGKKVPVKMKMLDTESNPTKAAELAHRLILNDKIDLMVVLHTPDTVNPTTAVCERLKMPCVAADVPIEAWLSGGPYHWSFATYWTVDDLTDSYISTWEMVADKTTKVIGMLFPNDPDGVTWSEMFHKKAPPLGYKMIDPGRFPYGVSDWTSTINDFKKAKVEIIAGVPIPPDFNTFWKQAHQMGFAPKICTVGRAMDFPGDAKALGGELALGITLELGWSEFHKYNSSLTGESAKDFCDAWEKKFKKYWNQFSGPKHAAWEIAYDVLNRAQTLDKETLRKTIAATDLKTIMGHVKFNEQQYAPTPVVQCQWIKGKRFPWEMEIINNRGIAEIPKTGDLVFPLPGYKP